MQYLKGYIMNVKKLFLIQALLSFSLFAVSGSTENKKSVDSLLPKDEYKYIVARCYSIDLKYAIEIFSTNKINAMPVFMNHNVIGKVGEESFFALTLNKNFYNGKSQLLARLTDIQTKKSFFYNANDLKSIPLSEGQIATHGKTMKNRLVLGGAMTFDLEHNSLQIVESGNQQPSIAPGFCEKVR